MSDETYQKLEEALAEHFADAYPGAYLTHWVLAAGGADPVDGTSTAYMYANSEGPAHPWIGLLAMQQARVHRWLIEQDL